MISVAINGYGRIGRVAHRIMLLDHPELTVVAINVGSSTDLQGWMYLLKYDSNYGPLEGHTLSVKEDKNEQTGQLGYLLIDDKAIPVFSQKDPALLPWKKLNVDVVIESTGHFLTEDKLQAHIKAGAKSVVLSAPAKDGHVHTYVLGVDDEKYHGEHIINNASCTTNCISPVAKIMVERFGVEKAMMTTIHAYTSDQELQDGGHKDYRRARAAAKNIVPTSTGATIAAAQVVPELQSLFEGLSVRVPVSVGSLSDFTFLLKREVTIEEVNAALTDASKSDTFKKYLAVTTEPLVSSDIIGNTHSSIVDLSLTQVVGGNLVKVIAWYDNEWGYANRLVEMVSEVGEK